MANGCVQGVSHLRAARVAGACGAAVLSLMLALTVLVSALYIAEFEEHDCAGEDCPVCLHLDAAQDALGAAASVPTALAALIAAAALPLVFVARYCAPALGARTPVTLRVKLVI